MMDFDPVRYLPWLAAALLIPGVLFLFAVVFYIAFIGKSAGGPSARAGRAGRTCVTCGQALLPDQAECPHCAAQAIEKAQKEAEPVHPASAEPPPGEEADAQPFAEAPIEDPDPSAAYEAELIDDPADRPGDSA